MIDETQKFGFCGPFFPDAYGVSMQYCGTAMITNISKESTYYVNPEFRIVDCEFSFGKVSKVTFEGPRGSMLGQQGRGLK